MKQHFWKGKKVLITGHTGFKGSWLSLLLSYLGSEVIGYSLKPPSSPSLYEVTRLDQLINSIDGDVRNYDYLKEVIEKTAPDIVFHMAAQSLVRPSYQDPITTYSTNVMGTVNLLEAIRQTNKVKVVINVTSDKCYENKEWLWGYRENEPMGGYDPYSNSKGCAELVTSAFRNSFFNSSNSVALASVRAGNVIGGGDWAKDRLIPDIIRALTKNEPIIIRNPQSIRPWQHVLEPLNGYLALAENLWEKGQEFAEGWNFGPIDEDAKTVSWIVEYLTQSWIPQGTWKLESQDQPHEANYLKLDCSKSRNRLNWEPLINLEHGLNWIVLWYSQYQSQDARQATLEQIKQFCQLDNSRQKNNDKCSQ